MAQGTTQTGAAGGRNIVLCLDGTNNDPAFDSTNVLRLFRSLVRDESQLAYYDPGVGTLHDPTSLSWLRKTIERKLDGAIGRTLCTNFCEAYRFLMHNHRAGDRVYMFGFSRGAYTARAVAGALHRFGLLDARHDNLVPYVWALYANDGEAFKREQHFGGMNRYRKIFARATEGEADRGLTVHMLGLWDTVSALGWIWNLGTLPHTANNQSVLHVRHAVSIDERRGMFSANLFDYDPRTIVERAGTESFKEVWFPGVHADVGGGYPDEASDASLAKISLRWMLAESEALGLRLGHDEARRHLGLTDSKKSRPDPLGTMHDELSAKFGWRLVQLLPRVVWSGEHRKKLPVWSPLASPRSIPEGGTVHQSEVDRRHAKPSEMRIPLPKKYTLEPDTTWPD